MEEDGSLERVFVEKPEGWTFSGDARLFYSHSDTEGRDGSDDREDLLRLRWRAGANWSITDSVRAGFRLAGLCSSDECDPSFVAKIQEQGIEDGDLTFDEAYIHAYRHEKFDFAIGRMQTKFVTKDGIFAKSLDRNDGSGSRIEWTDGFHGTYRHSSHWNAHFIVQLNTADGASNPRRAPLDFSADRARVSYFASLENSRATGFWVQRALDITYLPRSLQKDATEDGRLNDYWAIVARVAGRWPTRSFGARLRVSGEVGYAGETQTKNATGIAGDGDADGVAWAVTANIVDFAPGHSIGVNYGHTGAGWLLSSQYRNNETLAEVRYIWQTSKTLRTEIRARRRKEIERLTDADQRRDEFDVFVRFTWSFNKKRR